MAYVSQLPSNPPNSWGEPWSASEDDLLRRAYGKRPASSIAAELGRTTRAVQCRAHVLAIDGKRKSWGSEDDATLADLFPKMRSEDIAKQMGRTVHSVNRRIHDLRTRGDKRFPYKRNFAFLAED